MNLIIKSDLAPTKYQKIPGKNMYKLTSEVQCDIYIAPKLAYNYLIAPGYKTNFRSGPNFKLANYFISQIGTPLMATSWLIHDVNYAGCLDKEKGDKLLYYMLLYSGLSKFKAQIVFFLVTKFGGAHYDKKGPLRELISLTKSWEPFPGLRSQKASVQNRARLQSTLNTFKAPLKFDKNLYSDVKKELLNVAQRNNTTINIKAIEEYYEGPKAK